MRGLLPACAAGRAGWQLACRHRHITVAGMPHPKRLSIAAPAQLVSSAGSGAGGRAPATPAATATAAAAAVHSRQAAAQAAPTAAPTAAGAAAPTAAAAAHPARPAAAGAAGPPFAPPWAAAAATATVPGRRSGRDVRHTCLQALAPRPLSWSHRQQQQRRRVLRLLPLRLGSRLCLQALSQEPQQRLAHRQGRQLLAHERQRGQQQGPARHGQRTRLRLRGVPGQRV